MQRTPPQGMTAFTIVWFGQMVSFIGSNMTRFVLPIWVWQETGQATPVALMGLFGFAPEVLLSPIAGALVDRWNRKTVMILTDSVAALVTAAFMVLYAADMLQIWHLYLGAAIAGAFQSFQFPAYSAAISTMIPPDQYGRASGMMSLAESGSGILAPILAGALIALIDIDGIMLIDLITFGIAVTTLAIVHIPQPEISEEGKAGQGSLFKESFYGFQYIKARPSLLGLQMVFFFINLVATFGFTVMVPMILARTNNDEVLLGSVQSIGAVGGVIGGLWLSTWGGPKRRVHGVLLGMFFSSLLSTLLMGVGRGLVVWAAASFFGALTIPILNGSNQAIWQAKVPADLQGRVFAARRLIAQITAPLSMILAGPAADQVFEPAMQPNGALADTFGWLVGTGAGAGMGLMFVLAGVLGMAVGLGGYLFPVIRNAETLLPDHNVKPVIAAEPENAPTINAAEVPV